MEILNRMRPGDAHCGPVALGSVLGINAYTIMANWPSKWEDPKSDRKWWLWPIDTPWNHRKYLESIGKTMVSVNPSVSKFPKNSIALIHNFNWGRNPITRILGAILFQHWVVILDDDGQTVTVDWGTIDNPRRKFDRLDFLNYVNSGWPYCVYSVL